jgi:hypothetical protein
MENPNLRGGFAVKTFESPSIKPPYFDLSKPSTVITPETTPMSQNPNLLADWGYKPPPQAQPQYISPPSVQQPYTIEPITPVYDQKPQVAKPPDSVTKLEPPTSSSAFPFYQQPQRPPPRPVQPVIEKPPVISPPVISPPSQPVVSPPQQQVSMVISPTQQVPISRPPTYIGSPEPMPQVPGSMYGGYIQYASTPVVYPVSYPQKIPVNQVSQPTVVYNGSTGGYVMLPPGMMIPPGQVMAMPSPVNKGFNPVATPSKGSIMVVPAPNTVAQPQQRVSYVPNPIQQSQQQYYQSYQEGGYPNDVNLQKKKQIEDDEALARRLQEEENRNAY